MPADIAVHQFFAFLMILFRVTGLMVVAPFFGSRNIPIQVRVGLGAGMALAVWPSVYAPDFPVPDHLGALVVSLAGETVVGMLIGFSAALTFAAVQLGGQLIGQQVGLTLANVIDPVSNVQVSAISQLKFLFALALFLVTDAHHFLVIGMHYSFEVVPPIAWAPGVDAAAMVAGPFFADSLDLAVKVSAPVVVALLFSSVAMAFLARAVPEMNIFILGFSLRIVVGFLLMMAGVPAFAWLMMRVNNELALNLSRLIESM